MCSSTGTSYSYIFAFERVVARRRLAARSGLIDGSLIKCVNKLHHCRACNDDQLEVWCIEMPCRRYRRDMRRIKCRYIMNCGGTADPFEWPVCFLLEAFNLVG